jgi:hypothetical protein
MNFRERIQALKDIPLKRRLISFIDKSGVFAHDNKDVLIIMADPNTDAFFMAYQDTVIATGIRDNGNKINVIKKILNGVAFDRNIDKFLLQIDGGMKAISESLHDKKVNKKNKITWQRKSKSSSKNQLQSQQNSQSSTSMTEMESLSEPTPLKSTAQTLRNWLTSFVQK